MGNPIFPVTTKVAIRVVSFPIVCQNWSHLRQASLWRKLDWNSIDTRILLVWKAIVLDHWGSSLILLFRSTIHLICWLRVGEVHFWDNNTEYTSRLKLPRRAFLILFVNRLFSGWRTLHKSSKFRFSDDSSKTLIYHSSFPEAALLIFL